MQKRIVKMFEPCRAGDCDACAGETVLDLNDGMQGATSPILECGCECHEEWHPDRAYAAGYAYASGCAD